jgi:non-specific serine/threonine protein kinase
MVTLIGSGGSGKTRLGLKVADGVLDDYRDGVWFVEFGTITDPSLAAKAIASVLNVREQAGSSLEHALIEFAEHRSLLLMLDNCEHVLEECATLVDSILKSCPEVQILATSRESLGLSGELIFRVPSLGVPSHSDDFVTIRDSEAVQLFVDRAQLAEASFTLNEGNYLSVCRIVERLDGIPLAIELAAARVATMPTEALSARLDDSFRVLTGGGKATLPRQQTLRTMIDWSFNLLSEPEKAMLRRLSVFSGGWTLESAERVCADGEVIHQDDVLDLLLQLVGKSLAAYDELSSRYRLLETVRWYSLQKLADADEATQTRDRHLETFLDVAEGAKLTGADQVEALERLATEHENILAALDWCEASSAGVESALKIVSALGRFWYMHGHFSTGRKAIAMAVARRGASAPTKLRAEALVSAALLARVQGDLVAAEEYLSEAKAIYEQLQDNKGVSTTLNSLGNVMREGGRYEEAQAIWDQALQLRSEMGDKAGISVVRGNLGIIAMLRGNFSAADEHIQASLQTERELQRRSHEGIALSNLALSKMWQGDLEAAQDYCLLALEVNREVGTKLVESRDLHHLAQISVSLGKTDSAKSYLSASFKISRSLAAKELIADALETAASIMNREERFRLAAELTGAAERVRQESGCKMPPNEMDRYASEVERFKDGLGSAAADTCLERGRAMKTAEAVEAALSAMQSSSGEAVSINGSRFKA